MSRSRLCAAEGARVGLGAEEASISEVNFENTTSRERGGGGRAGGRAAGGRTRGAGGHVPRTSGADERARTQLLPRSDREKFRLSVNHA